MKFYTSVQKVKLTDSIIDKARSFAGLVAATTDYSDANQIGKDKIIHDHFVSKLGEEAAKMVMSRYTSVAGPDYAVYEGKQKSWEADLFVNKIPLAVKTQTTSAAVRYGLSWTFQCGVKRRDLILEQPEAWVVFVEYDDYNEPYQTCFVLPPFQMKDLVLGEPRLSHLKGHKKVVYAASLPKMEVEG